MNREAWLSRVVRALRPHFKAAGFPLPEVINSSCGWPSEGGTARRARNRNVAQCWIKDDGTVEIFVSPSESDSLTVAGLVAHELVHAALPSTEDHGTAFKVAASQLGLVGRPAAMRPGKALRAKLAEIIERVGPYPHVGLKP